MTKMQASFFKEFCFFCAHIIVELPLQWIPEAFNLKNHVSVDSVRSQPWKPLMFQEELSSTYFS